MFFIIIFSLILSVNGYLFVRGWQLMPHIFVIKTLYAVFFWGFLLLFMLRMYKGDSLSSNLAQPLSKISFTWFIVVIYLSIFALFIDLLRLLNTSFTIFPSMISENPLMWGRYAAYAAIFSLFLLLIHGNIKFKNPKISELQIKLEKPFIKNPLKIALISDLHLSSYINGNDLNRYIQLINNQKPDLILIAGDLVDRDLKPLKEFEAAERFAQLKSTYGTYAVCGNHEFYGGNRDKIIEYFSPSINFLVDSVVKIGDIQLIGRDDKTNTKRASLDKLIQEVDSSLPIILIDHQPFNLQEACDKRVDIQLSGHTHNGQFWPGNWIVKKIFEIPHGYGKKENTHYYVSSGLGLWGPRFRIGTSSEIVILEIVGK